jgi:hypothetical protein
MAARSLNAQQEFDGNLGELDAACELMLITRAFLSKHMLEVIRSFERLMNGSGCCTEAWEGWRRSSKDSFATVTEATLRICRRIIYHYLLPEIIVTCLLNKRGKYTQISSPPLNYLSEINFE